MTTQIALLRAINVGGRAKLAMADLRRVFVELGLANVRTLLQTGNVIFECEGQGGHTLETAIEEELAAEFDLQTDVLIRNSEEWNGIIAANPFPKEAESDPGHLVVMVLKDVPGKDAVNDLNAAIKGPEIVKAEGAQLYITYPDGIGRSKLTTALVEKRLATRGTGRNWKTVLKIAEALRG